MREPSPWPTPWESSAGTDEGLVIVRFDDIHDAGKAEVASHLIEPPEDRGSPFEDLDLGTQHLDRNAARRALEALSGSGVAVMGIDIIHAVGGRPLYPLQLWQCDQAMGEPDAAYCQRSQSLAQDFFNAYPDPCDGSIVYVVRSSVAERARAA